MKMFAFSLLPLFLLLFSCQPDDGLIDDFEQKTCMEYYDGPLDILWSTPIRKDTSVANSIYPVIFENNILYSELYFNKPNTIYSFSPETGKDQWSFSSFPWPAENNVIEFNNPTQAFDDKFYFNYGSRKALFNAKASILDWEDNMPYTNPRISAGLNYLYAVQFNKSNVLRSSEILRKSKIGDEEWESVYLKEYQNNEAQGFELPAEWISPDNETILIFRNYRLGQPAPTKSNIIAYNVTRDHMEWEIEDINEAGIGTIHLPIIHGSRAYITNVSTISCIDILTGTEVWETPHLGTSFFNCAPVIAGDRLIVNGDDGVVAALWLDTGVTSWRKNDSNHNPSKMEFYAGAVYYCTNDPNGFYLYGLNAQSGEVIYREDSPNNDCRKNARLGWGLSIDQASGKLYTHDGYFAICLQLEEY